MKIKIKDPTQTSINCALFAAGRLFLFFLVLGCAAVFCLKITPAQAWSTLGILMDDICADNITCRLGFTILFKITPFVMLGLVLLGLWEKKQNQRKSSGSGIHYITFKPDGVLLEKTPSARNLFFPYGQTTLQLTITAHAVYMKYGKKNAISRVKLVFSTPEETISVEHFPSKPQAFLCTLLDARGPFKEFSYTVKPLDSFHREAAQQVQTRLDNYRDTGFFSFFQSPQDRSGILWGGGILLLGGVLALFLLIQPFSLIAATPLFALGGICLWISLFDIYKEKKAKRKYKK